MTDTARDRDVLTADVRTLAGYGVPIAWITVLLALFGWLGPVGRFLGATVGLLLSIKVGAWILLGGRAGDDLLSPRQTLLFWTVWPGVRPDEFAGDSDDSSPAARSFLVGYAHVLLGAALVLASLLVPPVVGGLASTWLLLFGLLSILHFGIGRLLPFCLRWLGYPVPPLFDDPLASTSIGDFWSERWNRPFVGMNRLFLTRPLAPRVGIAAAAFLAFLASGVLHELALSYATGAGWGMPMLYFLLQAILYAGERRLFPGIEDRPVVGRLWTYAAILLPLGLLFHAPFRATFLLPLVEGGRALLLAHPPSAYLSAGLWAGAAGHFLVLAASYRVPEELDWETDLATLQPLNRKLMWTYGGYIVLLIVSFGVMTAAFHEQFLAGTPVALGVCGLIAVFWSVRILVDTFYFDHDDWPEGLEYVVGHAMLTSLFLLLVLIYAGTIAYHLL